MKSTIISVLVVPLLLASESIAQLSDWNNVRSLPEDTRIKVELKHGSAFGQCFFVEATNDKLVCGLRVGPLGTGWHQNVYARENVKAVFLAHNGMLIGIGAGAAAGAILGASQPGCCRGANAVIGAGLMAAPGAVVGAIAGPFFRGRAIYRADISGTKPPPSPIHNQRPAPSEARIPCLRDGVTFRCVDSTPLPSAN